jgi:hypothetical protein
VTPTLNLTESERRTLHRLVENELHSEALEDAPDYMDELGGLLDKLEGCR